MKKIISITSLLLVFNIIFADYSYANEQEDEKDFNNKINEEVARKELEKYKIVEKTGTKIEICVQAQMVTQAYLQAGNETKYKEWHQTQQDECLFAGIDNE